MPKQGKKFIAAKSRVEHLKQYEVSEALALVKDISFAKFDESVDLSVNLNVNPRHADQVVRGAVTLPHGTGKETRVLVFAKGEKAIEAREAGADFVGDMDLVEKIQDGWFDFDTAVATPDMMGQVGRIGRLLGPRGLMPNPKTGTVTFDVAKIVGELKAGRVEFRTDKEGIIHLGFGRVSFTPEKLQENLQVIIEILARNKPAVAKAPYFRTITVSSTMGPPVLVDSSFGANML